MNRHVRAAAVSPSAKAIMLAALGSEEAGSYQSIDEQTPARKAAAVKNQRIWKA